MSAWGRFAQHTRVIAAIAGASSLVGCAASGSIIAARSNQGRSSGTAVAALADSIASSLEGIHLDVLGGGAPSPGRSTTMLVQSDATAVESYWTTEGWCLSRIYSWEVTDVVDESHFSVAYHVEWEDTSCMSDWGDDLVLDVTAVRHDGQRTVLDGAYTSVWDEATERTVCPTAVVATCDLGVPTP